MASTSVRRFNSGIRRGFRAGEEPARHAARAAELLESLGFHVERHVVPHAEVTASGLASVVNLVVRERFGDGPVVACNAHGDVVPPGLGWTADPYGAEIRDGVMFGRGVAVSKSDFATYAFALRRMTAGRLASLTYLIPVVAILLGWALLDETPPALAVAGGGLCLAGVYLARRVS